MRAISALYPRSSEALDGVTQMVSRETSAGAGQALRGVA